MCTHWGAVRYIIFRAGDQFLSQPRVGPGCVLRSGVTVVALTVDVAHVGTHLFFRKKAADSRATTQIIATVTVHANHLTGLRTGFDKMSRCKRLSSEISLWFSGLFSIGPVVVPSANEYNSHQ